MIKKNIKLLENARKCSKTARNICCLALKLLEIFAAQLENCSKYILLGLARKFLENELLKNARLEFYFPCSKSLNNNIKKYANEILGKPVQPFPNAVMFPYLKKNKIIIIKFVILILAILAIIMSRLNVVISLKIVFRKQYKYSTSNLSFYYKFFLKK